jgi:Acetyltransferase (GNAT) domain
MRASGCCADTASGSSSANRTGHFSAALGCGNPKAGRPSNWPGRWIAPIGGNGYATEAAKAARDYGFMHLAMPKLVSLIDPENTPSQRVAMRLGETKGPPITVELYGRRFSAEVWEISSGRR